MMHGSICMGWGVLDADGRRLGTIARIYRPEPSADEEAVEVYTGFLGLGRRLRVPITAIRAAMAGWVLLSESCASYARGTETHRRPRQRGPSDAAASDAGSPGPNGSSSRS